MKILFFIALILTGFVNETKAADPLFAVELNNPAAVQYCTSPVLIAESLTIEGTFTITGMKISFSEGYKMGEDELVYTESFGNIAGTWVAAQGYLLLKGDISSTSANYRDAIKSVTYKNNRAIPTLGVRKISITLEDADYLPASGHFYRFISKTGIKWTDAQIESKSDAMVYFGLRGYMATITSQAENDFIKLKTTGVGWIGASDSLVEGEWRWVTGPEGLEESNQGRLFWRGTGYLAKSNPSSFGAVKNAQGVEAYHNWNKWDTPYLASLPANTWEPNQSGDEDYAHITVFPTNPNNSYKWNDLPNTGGGGDYSSKGYLIEYGGYADEPTLNLTATLELQVNTMLFNTSHVHEICEGGSVKLNIQDVNWTPGDYLWTPAEGLSNPTLGDASKTPNPTASPGTTTTYKVTGTRGACSDTASYSVIVHPAPVSLLNPEENICQGQSITLDPGVHAGYDWGSTIKTRTITVSQPGIYSVTLTSGKNCVSLPSATKVIVHEYPSVNLSNLQTLICGSDKSAVVNIVTDASAFSLESQDLKATVNGLAVSVPDFGLYPMVFKASHQYCPAEAKFGLGFYPVPVVNLGNDTTICNPATLQLTAGEMFADYLWSTAEITPGIVVKSDGTYGVNITDTNGCKTIDQVKVSFTNKPQIDFTRLDTLICGIKSALLDVTSDKGSFTVQRLSDSFVFNTLNVAVPDFGRYDFTVKATDQFSCSSDSVISFGFHKTPTVNFSVDSTKCYGYNLDVKYSGDATIASSDFTWVFGGDTIKRGIGIDAYLVPLGVNRATRDLTLKVTDQGCANDKTLSDIKVIPNLKISVSDSLGCEPFTTRFTAENTETVTYAWDFGDGTILSGLTADPSHTYLNDGYYPVKLEVTTDKGCSNEIVMDSLVYVAPIPTIGFTPLPAECLEKENHEISYHGSGDQLDIYRWNLTAFDNEEIIQNPDTTQGPFIFNLKNKPQALIGLKAVSKYGCRSDSATVLVKRKPGFSILPSQVEGCVPFEPVLTGIISDPADRIDFSWDFSDGVISSGSQVSHSYEQPDQKYTVTLSGRSSVTGCSDTLVSPDLLMTYPKPEAAFSMDNTTVYNDKPTVNFSNLSSGADTYLWDFGDESTSDVKDPAHYFIATGYRTVLLEAFNEFLCSDTVTHQLLVAFDRIFPPTGFSPNAPDLVDREFKLGSDGIASEGYHLTILSRWNDLVFEARNEIKGWNGQMPDESLAPAGTYIWILNFTDFLGRRHRQTGTVTLVY